MQPKVGTFVVLDVFLLSSSRPSLMNDSSEPDPPRVRKTLVVFHSIYLMSSCSTIVVDEDVISDKRETHKNNKRAEHDESQDNYLITSSINT